MRMRTLDHIGIPVSDYPRSRDWYAQVLGLEVEFDAPERRMAAVHDTRDLTIFLTESPPPPDPSKFAFWIQVDDLVGLHRELEARGIVFEHGPAAVAWGYGAELRDPDGYRICLWDEATMSATMSAT
jgi:catechol 2,3-dioxygenase-like lactoylglutathione lyase family enzyme